MRALMLSLALALAGCGGDVNPEPPDAFRPDGGPRDAFVIEDVGHDVGPSTPDTGTDANIDGGSDAGPEDTGVDAGPPDAFDCHDPTGCYRCPPSTNDQFINHCRATGVDCEPFPVTTTRLPHLRSDGTVPPLP